MATLVINRYDSYCGECRKSASPYAESHDKVYGYRPGEGCGAVFDSVASDYFGLNMKERIAEMRPDLEWVGFDE